MPFLKKKKSPHLKKLKSIVTKYNGWYVRDDFHLQVRRELIRSSRNGHPVCQVLIKLTPPQEVSRHLTEGIYHHFLVLLVESINENTRLSDIKILTEDLSKVGILLVDTSLDGARTFVEKLRNRLICRIHTRLQIGYFNPIKYIVLSGHPFTAIRETLTIDRIPLAIRKLDPAAYHTPFANGRISREMPDPPEERNGVGDGSAYLTYPLTFRDYLFDINSIILFDSDPRKFFSGSYQWIKRGLDIIGALTGILLFLPFFLIVPVVLKITSRGPVLFKQTRLGYRGKPFTLLKFRTMKVDSDTGIHREYVKKLIQGQNGEINQGEKDRPLYKIKNDPRVTPFGGFLRRTNLDEIPQFFNVLLGNMSLVGPRPPIPYEVSFYQDWHLQRILEVKPGITGLWQVSGRNRTTFAEMARLDLQYVRRQSLLLDLKIILKTIPVMFDAKSGI